MHAVILWAQTVGRVTNFFPCTYQTLLAVRDPYITAETQQLYAMSITAWTTQLEMNSWNTAVVCDVDHYLNHPTWNELGWCCIIVLLFTVFSATFKWLRWWMIIPCVLMVVVFNDWCLHSLPDDSEESTFPVHLTPASSPWLQLCTNSALCKHSSNVISFSYIPHYPMKLKNFIDRNVLRPKCALTEVCAPDYNNS